MEVETDDKEGFKDIVKAADDFASRVGSGKGVDKDKIHKGKGKGDSRKEKNRRSKARARKIRRVIPRGKSTQSDKKDGKGPKNVVSPGKTRGKNTGKGGKKNTGKSGSKGKNNGDKNGGKTKKGQK